MTIGVRYPHRITVFHPAGWDPATGLPAGVTTENVPARIEYGNRLIRNQAGEQLVSRAVIETAHPIEAGDTITIPGEETGQAALDVRRIDGLGGRESHREVYL